MSVLMINESLSTWKGFIGFSYEIPLAFTCCRIGKDHKPRAPPMAWSLRFVKMGRSRYDNVRFRPTSNNAWLPEGG